ncbi:carboxyltransferase domain-containing protein [Paenarthrobacter nicotinovorans]|uniref:carboxyltransferase domain-containing protein n=1 Tax=Paenarthrobacter nicotinovorans TaxID=29320 RepID=UPI00380053B6
MSTTGITFISGGPGKVLVEIGHTNAATPYVAELKQAVELLYLPGMRNVRTFRDGISVDYDCRIVEAKDVQAVLSAAYAGVLHRLGDRPSGTHAVPVVFGGEAGPDLPVASLLWNTNERRLVRRICRTKRAVTAFASPGVSPLLDVQMPACWRSSAQLALRPAKAVPNGSLILSAAGLTITTRSWQTGDLVIGRLCTPHNLQPKLSTGDTVWLRAVWADEHAPRRAAPDRVADPEAGILNGTHRLASKPFAQTEAETCAR